MENRQDKSIPQSDNKEAPKKDLGTDFWMDLLNPPACKRGENCDNCGRCEH